MNDIDQLLKSAKSSVPNLPENFDDRVMSRISEEGIVVQSGSPAIVNRRTGFSFGIFVWIIAIIVFSYNFYEIKMNGTLELLYFGTRFLGSFLGNLPWDLLLVSLILTALSAWILKKSGYIKKGIALTLLASYLVTGVGGTALAATGLNNSIEAGIQARRSEWPWLNLFYNERATEFIHHPNFKMGRVDNINNGTIIVITPHGDRIQIQLPRNARVEKGQILRISGEEAQDFFRAQKIHICKPDRVMRYFDHMKHHKQMMPSCCSKKGMMRH